MFKPISSIKDTSGNIVTGDDNICDLIANHFSSNHSLSFNQSSVFDNSVSACINNMPHGLFINFSDNFPALPVDEYVGNTDLTISTGRVLEIIHSRKNKSAVGLDQIPYSILKLLDPKIIEVIAILFNHLITLGYFPECWKQAVVVPIPKAGKDLSLTTNWRPISLLSCLSKIFERIVAERVINFANNNNVLPNHQFGFRAGHSTCHPLALLQNKICSGLNNNKITSLICLDVRAAFDTVWHDALLYKMHMLNFPIYIINIISYFLSNRSFIVKLGNSVSNPKSIVAGVPQGSVLGLILFSISNFDIPRDSDFDLFQFADDTAIAISHGSSRGIERKINNYLASLSKWYHDWKFLLKESKTDLIHFVGNTRQIGSSRRRNARNLNIKINGSVIAHKKSIKYLGVHLSANNRFNEHIKQTIVKFHKARSTIAYFLFSQLSDVKFKRLLYSVYLRPILTYAAPVWFNPSCVSSHQIEK